MRLRTQLLLLVAAVALSPVLVSAIYAGANALLRQRTDVVQRDFPPAMRAIRDDLPRVLAGEQESIDLPDGVELIVLDTENLVLFSTGTEYGRGAAVDPRELLHASREDRDTRTMLEPLFRDGELAGTFLLSVPGSGDPRTGAARLAGLDAALRAGDLPAAGGDRRRRGLDHRHGGQPLRQPPAARHPQGRRR